MLTVYQGVSSSVIVVVHAKLQLGSRSKHLPTAAMPARIVVIATLMAENDGRRRVVWC